MLARGGGAVWRTDIDSLGGLEALVSSMVGTDELCGSLCRLLIASYVLLHNSSSFR